MVREIYSVGITYAGAKLGEKRWNKICEYTTEFKSKPVYTNPSNFVCDKELKKDLVKELQ